MKRLLSVVMATISLLACFAAPAAAQYDCGLYVNENKSYQFGTNNWLEYIVETRRKADIICALYSDVGVEARVVNVANSNASAQDNFVASVRRQVPVPDYGSYQTNGTHYRTWLGIRYSNGASSSRADVARQSTQDCSSMNGGGNYYVWDYQSQQCVEFMGSPIIIDTKRDGFHLTSAANGVNFDLDTNGVPELIAWTEADSDDGWLAMDRNGNG